ncbi:MAG TPA: Nif3-like dinuclear metal center hexameric protein [Polyangiaceae bacterium]|nr:Nif3-like dinuclear metal center hexameric protein [Polyangiaceae bacterium]
MTVALSELLAALERLAPLAFAEAWDNVGLLVEPTPVSQAAPLSSVLLTIDLSDDVVAEAQSLGAGLIVAYHPPIFQGLKRLRSSVASERAVVRCVAAGISVFSPHTALDAAPAGVNVWLTEAFGAGTRGPCVPSTADTRYGQGRFVRLDQPISLTQAVQAIKQQLGLTQLRVAAAAAHAADAAVIRNIAVCAGAGGSMFEKLSGHDLYVTGEMRHHDVRARAESGSSVVLSEHTHTERGFLPILASLLKAEAPTGVLFHVSQCDREPLSLR